MLILCKEITEAKKNKKDTAPVRKVNTRGVLKIDGYSDFNPDLNL
jgi:predicted acetyltransferase